jgi:hypothetical protein
VLFQQLQELDIQLATRPSVFEDCTHKVSQLFYRPTVGVCDFKGPAEAASPFTTSLLQEIISGNTV